MLAHFTSPQHAFAVLCSDAISGFTPSAGLPTDLCQSSRCSRIRSPAEPLSSSQEDLTVASLPSTLKHLRSLLMISRQPCGVPVISLLLEPGQRWDLSAVVDQSATTEAQEAEVCNCLEEKCFWRAGGANAGSGCCRSGLRECVLARALMSDAVWSAWPGIKVTQEP